MFINVLCKGIQSIIINLNFRYIFYNSIQNLMYYMVNSFINIGYRYKNYIRDIRFELI